MRSVREFEERKSVRAGGPEAKNVDDRWTRDIRRRIEKAACAPNSSRRVTAASAIAHGTDWFMEALDAVGG